MKKRILVLIILTALLLCSCSGKSPNLSSEKSNSNEIKLQTNQEEKLPENFTIDNIKSAFLEYINYRLWLYPAKIIEGFSDKDFDNYIGKSIDIEIRVYDNSKDSVFIHTSIGKWLAIFKAKNGFVYCDGQTSKGEFGYPSDLGNYKVVEKYSTVILQPHKPNYGKSQQKDKLIGAIEATIRASCEDYYKGADKYYDEWINVDVYIVDFYEYEVGTHAWLCRQDGSITDYPVMFEEKNGEINLQPCKGFTIDNKSQFNEFGRFQFDRDISDAVKHFKWNPQKVQ